MRKIGGVSFMQSIGLSKRQSVELCDEIGKMLAIQLDSATNMNRAKRIISDYLKKNMIEDDPEKIMKNVKWSVKVEIKQ